MAGWGQFFGAIGNLLPSRRESKQNQIERLIDENSKLSQEEPLSARTADRIGNNLVTIKRLRSEISNIT